MYKETELGAKLKRIRLELGLTIGELGQLLDVSGNTIARWERGSHTPSSPGMLWLALEMLMIRRYAMKDDSFEKFAHDLEIARQFDRTAAEARKRAPRIREELEQLKREMLELSPTPELCKRRKSFFGNKAMR